MKDLKRISGMPMAMLELVKIGLALYGIFLLIVHGSRAYEAYNSQFWPTTVGEITRSAVDASGDSFGNRQYRSTVKYAYAIIQPQSDQPQNDEDAFISERVSLEPSPRTSSRAAAEAQLELYPKGSSVQVYYNPNRPERSLLEPYFSPTYLMLPFVGLLCIGAALALRQVGRVS